jgi:hypothetical protein
VAARYVLNAAAALRSSGDCSRSAQAHHSTGETTPSTWTTAPTALKTEDAASDPEGDCRSLRPSVKDAYGAAPRSARRSLTAALRYPRATATRAEV